MTRSDIDLEAARRRIAELEREVAELRLVERRFEDFAEVSADWFWEMGADLRFTWMSATPEHLPGAQPEARLGKRRIDILDADNDPQAVAEHLRVLEAREPFHDFVYRRTESTGRTFWISTSGKPFHDENGAFAGYRGAAFDITARMHAEQATRESEAMLRSILEYMPSHLSLKDREGRLVLANPAWLAWFGLSLDEARGTSMAELLPDDVVRTIEADDLYVLRTGRAVHRENEVTGPAGEPRSFLVERFPVRDAEGEISAVGVISTDISERKRIEGDLARHRERLEDLVAERTRALEEAHVELIDGERLATLGQIVGTVSHELRNPLGTIQSSVYMLRKELSGRSEAGERALARIERNIVRCVRIIEDLLSYSRERPLVREPVDVDAWLAALLEENPAPPGIDVHRALGVGREVSIDAERLRQAVVNVWQNAWQAIATGRGRGQIRVSAAVEDGTLVIAVVDDGPGIPPELAGRIFEPLFSTKSFGFGLGMALVKQIAEQHGGTVIVEPAATGGTSVTLAIGL